MATNKRELVFKRGLLSNRVIDYLRNGNCEQRFIPTINTDFYFDWLIIGFEYRKYFGYTHIIDNQIYPIKPNDISYEEWCRILPEMRKWLNWMSRKIFYPTVMIGNKYSTDLVLLRIGLGLLMNIGLPRHYEDNIWDNVLDCYYNRKRPLDNFYYREILGIPF